jgi:AraC family transcriptional regulator
MAQSIVSGELATHRSPNGRATQTEDDPCKVASRIRLLDLSVGLVEDLRRRNSIRAKSAEDFCPVFQVCLPYRGIFVWHVGGDEVVGDVNQVVFVKADEHYQMSSPLPGGYAELIVTPELDILSELARTEGAPLARHPLFRGRSRRANPRLQMFRTRFLHWASDASTVDELEAEELVLALLRSSLHDEGRHNGTCGAGTARLIRRTKAFLEGQLSNRILLADVGRAVGASCAYLTDVFRRVEGVSLHRYLTQLRLARALVELPHAGDLTTLALDVGFSSHSHFSAAFRRAFGCTPSQFRRTARSAVRPSPP